MASGWNCERWLKDFQRQAQYYGIRDPEEKKQALVVFGGREVTICEDSLPDLDNNGDVYERMFQKHNSHFELRMMRGSEKSNTRTQRR